MPYTSSGKCVYKKNKDGSRGKKVGCTKGSVKQYLKALYANTDESVDKTLSEETMRLIIREELEEYLKEITDDNG
mgnify:FL=1|tara:strand:+ start:582 stop:806 length:225 start_codon:yes stop_codon:yes gene_type:complete